MGMGKQNFNAKAVVVVTALITIVLVACGKKRDTILQSRVDMDEVAKVDTKANYLYLQTISSSDAASDELLSHFASETKLVKMEFNKSSLDIFEVETDDALKREKVNNRPVISVPVSYQGFRCVKNDFGECTNREEQDNYIDWNKKPYFTAKWDSLNLQEMSVSPITFDSLSEKCLTQKGQRLVDYELTDDSLNVELERVYNVTDVEKCLKAVPDNAQDFFSRLSFKVRIHLSMVKASSVTDASYTPVKYGNSDQSKFGFFTTDRHTLDVDGTSDVESAVTYLSRWSPNRKEIVYYLSEEFNLPEYAKLKKITLEAGKVINQAFKEANSPVNFVVKEPVEGMKPGDIRHSLIVLSDPPSNTPILGYGPSQKHPLTGEIVSGRVVMYAGNIKTTIKRTWDELVLKELEARRGKKAESKLQDLQQAMEDEESAKLKGGFKVGKGIKLSPLESSGGQKVVPANVIKTPFADKLPSVSLDNIVSYYQNYSNFTTKTNNYLNEIEFLSKNNYYPAELFNFEGIVGKIIKDSVGDELLKPWVALTDVEKVKVIDLVFPYVWTPTLIHEIGHNLGLRHNFAGSEDRDNFYDPAQGQLFGVDYPIALSSVMDYPFDKVGTLPFMGKYDIAALRYAYAREIVANTGEIIKLEGDKTIAETLSAFLTAAKADDKTAVNNKVAAKITNLIPKSYRYCTDEHVEVNPGCKRHDSGVSLADIARNLVDVYENYYKYRNFRNGAHHFVLEDDHKYAERIAMTFRYMRNFLERHEEIKKYVPDEKEWTMVKPTNATQAFLKDLREATNIVAKSLMQVVKQPDVHCAVTDEKGKSLLYIPLALLTDPNVGGQGAQYQATSCFDPDLPWKMFGFKVLAEGGKHFNSQKAKDSPSRYVDEVDIRGIWADKLLALGTLTSRHLDPMDLATNQSPFSFLTSSVYNKDVKLALLQVILDEVNSDMTLKDDKGETNVVKATVTLSSTHNLRPSFSGKANSMFGLPTASSEPYSKRVVRSVIKGLSDGVDLDPLLEEFSVYVDLTDEGLKRLLTEYNSSVTLANKTLPPEKQIPVETLETISKDFFAGHFYYALPVNTVAVNLIERLKAIQIFTPVKGPESMEKFGKAVPEIYKITDAAAREAKKAELIKTLAMNENEIRALNHIVADFTRFALLLNVSKGIIQSPKYYQELLQELKVRRF